jgi:hypothetical protein
LKSASHNRFRSFQHRSQPEGLNIQRRQYKARLNFGEALEARRLGKKGLLKQAQKPARDAENRLH